MNVCSLTDLLPKVKASLSALGGPVQITQEWNLIPLHQDGIDGSGVNIIILDTDIYDWCDSVIDKGASLNVKNFTYIDQFTETDFNHGSVVASIAAGIKSESLGFEGGVAPAASLGIYVVSLDGKSYPSQSVCNALKFLLSQNFRVDILLMSFGFQKIDNEIAECIDALTNWRVVCVAAAGNDGLYQSSVMFPACDKNVISVGSCRPTGQQSMYNPSANIDVYAPGENLAICGTCVSGSSYAAPAVAGLIALLIQQVRKLEKPDMERHIRNVDVLRKIFNYDLKARGRDILLPHELLREGPQKLQEVIRKYV